MKSLLILLVVAICFNEARSQNMSDALNLCSGAFDQFAQCTNNAVSAQKYDGTWMGQVSSMDLEVHIYYDFVACYNESKCKPPTTRYSGDNTANLISCRGQTAGGLENKMNECLMQTFGSLVPKDDQPKLMAIVPKVVGRGKQMSYYLGGWNGYARPSLQDATTIGAACNTTAKQDMVNNCSRAAYDKAQVVFDNYCNAHAACYQGLGQCSQLYDILKIGICGCQNLVYSRANVISNGFSSCLTLPQYMVDIIPRQNNWCDTTPMNWCQSFGNWWHYAV